MGKPGSGPGMAPSEGTLGPRPRPSLLEAWEGPGRRSGGGGPTVTLHVEDRSPEPLSEAVAGAGLGGLERGGARRKQ